MSDNNQLQILDKILELISEKQNSSVSEKELFAENFIDNTKLKYLLNNEYIIKTKVPINYKLSQKGKIFISDGGFVSENNKKRFDRFINSTHLIISSIVLIISLLFTYYSKNQNSKNINKLEIHISNLNLKIDTLKMQQHIHERTITKLNTQFGELVVVRNSEISQPITKNIVHLADSTKNEDESNK